jgi:hypothetical protein
MQSLKQVCLLTTGPIIKVPAARSESTDTYVENGFRPCFLHFEPSQAEQSPNRAQKQQYNFKRLKSTGEVLKCSAAHWESTHHIGLHGFPVRRGTFDPSRAEQSPNRAQKQQKPFQLLLARTKEDIARKKKLVVAA